MHLASPWQASLFLRSLKEPQHAARHPAEDLENPDEPKNHLAQLVRVVILTGRGDVSLGRGGAEVYFELLKLCTNVEELTMYPSLLKSAT